MEKGRETACPERGMGVNQRSVGYDDGVSLIESQKANQTPNNCLLYAPALLFIHFLFFCPHALVITLRLIAVLFLSVHQLMSELCRCKYITLYLRDPVRKWSRKQEIHSRNGGERPAYGPKQGFIAPDSESLSILSVINKRREGGKQ